MTATAAVFLASGSAYASDISDFTAKATCDTGTGEARAAITVTDKDPSGTPADITVRIRMAVGSDGETLGTGRIEHPTAAGASTTVLVPWLQGYQWNIYVTAGDVHEELLTNLPISPDTPCVASSSHPSATPTGAAPSTSPAASATPSSSAAAPAAPTSPAPSTSAPSPAAGNGLAATGGGSDTALIVGSAAVVITAGAGVLFVSRRRTAAARH
ncbi:LAETG motif-containing sortase-dependent surface protein [Streptomyces scabiei]|uniref:LAETG motif-containing sortase-dependent surface protein n=1 Tax=Streptomyces scabiei TaxID=1930 RepID=UPI0029AE1D40|nr:LAETG motif-containing sortase-dependent surface protein [Streptomyces scabiei]MDX3117706.1 LAETG motif-containing sortase-dependent surface protein [Streptomyces scabiei]